MNRKFSSSNFYINGIMALCLLATSCFCSRSIDEKPPKKQILKRPPASALLTFEAQSTRLTGNEKTFNLILRQVGDQPIDLSLYTLQLSMKVKDINNNFIGGGTFIYKDRAGADHTASSLSQVVSYFTLHNLLNNNQQLTLSFTFVSPLQAVCVNIMAQLHAAHQPTLLPVKIIWTIPPKDQITQQLIDKIKVYETADQPWGKRNASKQLLKILEKLKNEEILNENEQSKATYCAALLGEVDILKVVLRNMPDFKVDSFPKVLGDASTVEMAAFLMKKGCDPNVILEGGWTPFQWAIRNGSIEVVRYLAAHGADVNEEKIRKQGKAVNLSMHNAIGNGSGLEMVKALLEIGVPLTDRPDNSGDTVLHGAARLSSRDLGEFLLQKLGTVWINDKNHSGSTALHLAALSGNMDMMDLLLNIPDIAINTKNNEGNTPLHLAAKQGETEIIARLLQHSSLLVNEIRGVDGSTALHEAIVKGHIEAAKLLINYENTNVNLQNKAGNTPLHLAVEASNPTLVEPLLRRDDIQIAIINNVHKTALELADTINDTAIIELFKKKAAGEL